VFPDGSVSKPVTTADEMKLKRGSERCREIMVKAGVDPKSIVVSKPEGAHPGGTAAIGEVVDQNRSEEHTSELQSRQYLVPTAPGLPPMLTIGALAKYLARRLVA